jgi:ABC-type uncharacterized transport system substrate-binding protein
MAPAMPVIGFVNAGSEEASASYVAAFRKGLAETGYVEGQNVTVEYHWLEGQFDRLPTLMADLVRRRVAVIATPGTMNGSIAAKAATATIPIVFGVADDPCRVQIATLATRGRIAAVSSNRDHVVAGGLMSYGTDVPDRFRQTGVYAGKILNGAKPADLPVLQPTKFELVINLKTANALGLTVPETLLATADEVIQ